MLTLWFYLKGEVDGVYRDRRWFGLAGNYLWLQSFLTISYALAANPTRVIDADNATANIRISNPIIVIIPFLNYVPGKNNN